jgi:sulfur relay (sulfurtransferase) DsrF/TusC family protein
MKALNVIETAYRATLEEQDDTIVWLSHAMKGAGADLDVLLRGNAVNYAVAGQKVAPLSFGARRQKQAPRLADDIAGLVGKGVTVYVVEDDLKERGLAGAELVSGLTRLPGGEIAALFERYDQVWHW